MYKNVTKGDIVVIKEGSHFDWCLVKEASIDDDMRVFKLISKLNGKTYTVSISMESMAFAYCPWRFIPANELTSYTKED